MYEIQLFEDDKKNDIEFSVSAILMNPKLETKKIMIR